MDENPPQVMTTERDQILNRVRTALAPLPQRAALPDWDRELVQLRAQPNTTNPWEQFCQRFAAVNGTPLSSLTELTALLAKTKCTRGYCDPQVLPLLRDALPPEIKIETTFDGTRVDDYQFGITRATGAIAETGTIILSDQVTSSRLGALAPWLHIAVLAPQDIHRDISAAIAALPNDPNIVWVTGPSKTADVEGILIEGVHGPGIQAAILL